jgi:hypothetical protein
MVTAKCGLGKPVFPRFKMVAGHHVRLQIKKIAQTTIAVETTLRVIIAISCGPWT